VINEKNIDLLKVAIYARVSSNQNRANLDTQVTRLKEYSMARGYQIVEVVKEVGSGVNDNRKKLKKLLESDSWGTLIVEHKDRLTRFGFDYIEILLNKEGRKIEVVNLAEDEKSDLMQDLVSIIYSFCTKMYGLRLSKRKTEEIIKLLEKDSKNAKNI
jgi:predicted site-specific integrase-resolvase